MKNWFHELVLDIVKITFDLYKIMIPVIILVKIIEELGGIETISYVLAPIMQLAGLPESMGLVWATTIVTNIYGGILIFLSMTAEQPLTVAQVTTLGGMMLLAHSIPIEGRIVQKAGVRLSFNLLLRVGGALVFGILLHKIYLSGNWLQETNHLLWRPTALVSDDLASWIESQIKTLLQVFAVIAVLVSFLRVLKSTGFERLLIVLLSPLLRLLGLGNKTATITIIGMNLGLTYGGGLLINEAKKGELNSREIFGAISLIAICHSLIEDTLLVMLLGADITGVLYFRLIFAFVIVGVGMRIIINISDVYFYRFLGIKT